MYNCGALKDKVDSRDYKIAKFLSPLSIPTQYDLTHIMSPVRDQGQFPECVAFATAAVKEAEEIGEGQMSPQFIYNIIGQPGGGSYPRDAMKALVDFGICQEKFNPYHPTAALPNTEEMFMAAKPNKIKAYARLTTLDEMKRCLFQNGPFIIAVGVTNNWFSTGKDGIVLDGGDIIGYHGITFVGYDDIVSSVKIKNSWGEGWGQNGYGYINYEMFMRVLVDAWSSIDIPESEEEKIPLPTPAPIPVKDTTFWQQLIVFIKTLLGIKV
jgi:C1A family cysteine protease